MPNRIVFSPEADAQVVGIYRFIAREASAAIAERFTASIVDEDVVTIIGVFYGGQDLDAALTSDS